MLKLVNRYVQDNSKLKNKNKKKFSTINTDNKIKITKKEGTRQI